MTLRILVKVNVLDWWSSSQDKTSLVEMNFPCWNAAWGKKRDLLTWGCSLFGIQELVRMCEYFLILSEPAKKCQYLFVMFPSVLMEQSIISGPVPLDYCFVFIGGVGSGCCVCVCMHAHACVHSVGSVAPNSLLPWWAYSPPGSSVHGILQARILEWDAIAFSHIPSSCHLNQHSWLTHWNSHENIFLHSIF